MIRQIFFPQNVVAFLIFLIWNICSATDRAQLFKDVIDKYDARVAPFNTKADAATFTLTASLMSIRQVSEKDQTVALSYWLYMGWMDHRLTWTPSSYSGIDSIVTTSKYVWSPSSICLYNEINEDKCLTADKPVTITSFGWMTYVTSRESVTQCAIDITKYPFDSHSCCLYFGNLFETVDFLTIMLDQSGFFLQYYTESEEWEMVETSLKKQLFVSNNMTYTQLHFNMKIKRRPTYVILSVFLPVIILSVLNIFCFVIPIESGEKMGTSMAIFLTFAVFMTIINESLPKSDNTPYFSMFLVTQLLISGVTVVLQSIVLHVHFREAKGEGEENKVHPLDASEKDTTSGSRLNCVILKCLKINAKNLDRLFMVCVTVIDFVSLVYFLAIVKS